MMTTLFSNLMANVVDIIVYAAIALVTLIGVFKCLLPLRTTTHALRRAIRRLQQDAGNHQGTPVWQEKRFMGNRLKGSWLRFLQNAEQLDRRGLPCNVEDYINDDTVTHGPGNATLAELIPGLLTSLGILGTFMGMMRPERSGLLQLRRHHRGHPGAAFRHEVRLWYLRGRRELLHCLQHAQPHLPGQLLPRH